MNAGPDDLLKDAIDYAAARGISIAEDAQTVIWQAEDFAKSLNNYLYDWTFMAAVLHTVKPVRAALAHFGVDPDHAVEAFAAYARHTAGLESATDPYDPEDSYSKPLREGRQGNRARLIDLAIECAKRDGTPITGVHLFDVVVQRRLHDQEITDYPDDKTRNTLSTFIGYEPSLLVPFSELREHLGLRQGGSISDFTRLAPPSVRSSLAAFLVDHPQYDRNCFLMMPFSETTAHQRITRALKQAMKTYGFNVVRADEKAYGEDLLTNVQAHLHGCRFGIAVFERILTNDFNPNVSLEVGYLMGMRKPICLLKERSLPKLPSDLVGRLYVEFDNDNLKATLRSSLEHWLISRNLISRP